MLVLIYRFARLPFVSSAAFILSSILFTVVSRGMLSHSAEVMEPKAVAEIYNIFLIIRIPMLSPRGKILPFSLLFPSLEGPRGV